MFDGSPVAMTEIRFWLRSLRVPPRTFSNAGRGLPHVFADGGHVGPKLEGRGARISHGWGDAAGWPGTGRNPLLPQKPGCKSLAFACSPAGSQEFDGSCPRFREAKPSNSNNHIN